MLADRADRIRARMAEVGVDVLLLSVGPDLPYLTGYEAMPLERLTMLVLPREGDATLVVPALEAPRVTDRPEVFGLRPWGETEDPVAIVAGLVGAAGRVAVGDRTWARFVLDLQAALPGAAFSRAAAEAVDRIAADLQAGAVPLAGRTEAEVSADLGRRIVAEGHQHVNFAIVAAGANAASPHHEAGARVIAPGDVVLCDFGGTMLDAEGVG